MVPDSKITTAHARCHDAVPTVSLETQCESSELLTAGGVSGGKGRGNPPCLDIIGGQVMPDCELRALRSSS